MKKYKAIVEGVEKFFNVTPDRYDEFIAKHPDAVLVEGPETEEDSKADTETLSTAGKLGFQKDTAESADVVSEDVAQENTDLLSGNGSLDLPNSSNAQFPLVDKVEETVVKTEGIDTPIELDEVILNTSVDEENLGNVISEKGMTDILKGDSDTAIRTLETLVNTSKNENLSTERVTINSSQASNKVKGIKITYTNPENGEQESYLYNKYEEDASRKSRELISFLDKNLGYTGAANLYDQSRRFNDSKIIKELRNTEKQAINLMGNRNEIFQPIKQTRFVNKMIDKGGGVTVPSRVEEEFNFMPYEKEIAAMKDELCASNLKSDKEQLSAEDLNTLAEDIVYKGIIANKQSEIVTDRTAEFFNENSKFRDEFALYNNIDYGKNENKKKKLDIISDNYQMQFDEYETIFKNINKFSKDGMSYTLNLEGKEVTFGEYYEGETLYKLGDGVINEEQKQLLETLEFQFQATIIGFNDNLKKVQDLTNELPTSKDISKASALNYSVGTKAANTIAWGSSDILAGTLYTAGTLVNLAAAVNSPLSFSATFDSGMNAMDKIANAYSDKKTKANNTFVRSVTLEEGFDGNPLNFGKFLLQEGSGQLPILAAVTLGGGWGGAVVGVFSGGNKGIDMAYDYSITGEKFGRGTQLAKMLGYGAANGVFTQLTTVPILNNFKLKMIKDAKVGGDFFLGAKEYFKTQSKNSLIYEPLLEVGGEEATNLVENLIDGRPMFENASHVAVTSIGFSFMFSYLPLIKGMVARTMSNPAKRKEITDKMKEVAKLQRQFTAITNKNSKGAQAWKKMLQTQEASLVKLVDQQFAANLNGVTERGGIMFLATENAAQEAKARAADAIADKTLSNDQKNQLVNAAEAEFLQIKTIQDLYLGEGFKNEFVLLEAANPDEYAKFIEQAKADLQVDKIDRTLINKATQLYHMQKARESVAQKKKINPRYEVFETADEAVDAINANDEISNANKKAAINNVKDGGSGSNIPIGDGSNNESFPFVVLENQAANYKSNVGDHEVTHGVVDIIFKGQPEKLIQFAEQIDKWLENASSSVRLSILENVSLYSNQSKLVQANEYIANFFEAISDNKIDLASPSNAEFSGLAASIVQDISGSDYDFEFRGVKDFAAFAVSLGKGIKNGSINIERASEIASKIKADNVESSVSQDKSETSLSKPLNAGSQQELDAALQALEDAEAVLDEDFDNPQSQKAVDEAEAAFNAVVQKQANQVAGIEEESVEEVVSEEINEVAAKDFVKTKKDPSTKKRSLTPEVKSVIEKKIVKAKTETDKLVKKQKAAIDKKLKEIDALPSSEMERTPKAALKKLAKNNPVEFAKQQGIEVPKPAGLAILEKEISEDLKVPIEKFVNSVGVLFYKMQKPQVRDTVDLNTFLEVVRGDVLSLAINEFKKKTVNRQGEEIINDIEDIIFSRGGLRIRDISERLITGKEKTSSTKEIKSEEISNVKKIKPSSILAGTKNRYNRAKDKVKEFWAKNKDNEKVRTFKGLKSVIDEVTAEIFGVSPSALSARSGNLNKPSMDNALKNITEPLNVVEIRNANGDIETARVNKEEINEYINDLNRRKLLEKSDPEYIEGYTRSKETTSILDLLTKFFPKSTVPEYFYADGDRGDKLIIEKDTGIGNKLKEALYVTKERGGLGSGNTLRDLSDVTFDDMLDVIGAYKDTDGVFKFKDGVNGRSPEGLRLLELVKLTGKYITNELSRTEAGLDPMTIADFTAGKNDQMFSKKLPSNFFSNNKFSDWRTKSNLKVNVGDATIKYLADQHAENPMSLLDVGNALMEKFKVYDDIQIGRKFRAEFVKILEKEYPNMSTETAQLKALKDVSYAFGEEFKYITQEIAFNNEWSKIENIKENKFSREKKVETINNFIKRWSRATRNLKLLGVTRNDQLFKKIGEASGLGKKGLNDLLFTTVKENGLTYIRYNDINLYGFRSTDSIKKAIKKGGAQRAAAVVRVNTDAKLARETMYEILDEFIAKGDTRGAHAALALARDDMDGLLHKVSSFGKYIALKESDTLIMEHETDVQSIYEEYVKYIDQKGNKSAKNKLNGFLDEAYVNLVSADLNALLDKNGGPNRYNAKEAKRYIAEAKIDGIYENYLAENKKLADSIQKFLPKILRNKSATLSESLRQAENYNEAILISRDPNASNKGISVWDFDDTLAQTKSNVLYTMPDGSSGKLTAEQFAKNGDRLTTEGAKFDFSEFSKVMNGKKGPMFAEAMARNKKFGNKNVYILTARPANSAIAIHKFLKGIGLNIPSSNITGLANSSSQAKANWVVGKAAEGYNNFYFADDHIGNVKAVKEVLNVLDVKNKVHQAIVSDSKKLKKQYSAIIAKRRGGMTITDAEASSGYIEQQIDNSFEYMEGAVKDETLPKQELSKAKKMGLHFLANSAIKFPEDGYKIIDALSVATKNKVDPFTFKNVDVLLSTYADSVSLKPMDPNSEKEFTNKSDVPNSDISIYDIANTRAGQEAVREAVDTNWGVKANPWCVIARQRDITNNVIEFWENVVSTNVDSQFATWTTVYPDGEVVRSVANQAGMQNRVVLTDAEMDELTIGKKSRPGVIKTDEQVYDDEVNQDDGRVGILTYQEWMVLSDPNQTKEEFEAGGGVLYPPEPTQETVTEGEPHMKPEYWNMYGSPDTEGSVGGWKIAFKGGKLLSLKNLGTDVQSWWDRMDRPSDDLKVSQDKTTYTTINTKTGKTKINKIPVIKESKKLDNTINGIITSDTAAEGILGTPATMALGSLDSQFNKFLEGSTGIDDFKRYKSDKAKLKGRFKGKLDIFIPPSAEDFLGLLYQTLNKGELGEAQMKFYEDNLLKPYAKANSALRSARVRSIREFDAIKKKLKIVPKDLKKSFKFEDENGNMKDSLFSKEQAIRVYIWNAQGIEMPNLSQVDLAVMVNHVNAEPELKAFADELLKLNRGMKSKAPSKNWMDGNIGIDLQANLNSVGRKKLLEVWQQNVDAIFSEENLNKLEAAYGPEYVKALKNSLRRMRTGRSAAPVTDNEAGNNLIMWLNSAVGNIMFFNNRSALLQMLSATNFLNFEDNNIIAAGKALMDIKQYSKDFVMLMNSDYLVDRRDGTRININEADIALIAKQSGITGVIAKILEAGFMPTKYADSLAIGIGGATFYRTKVNALRKDGMSKAKAEAQAMQEFISVAETSQQSSDQSKISMEQAGSVGKIILAFNNTSSQYSRIIKRSVQDLYNRRGSDKANLARIVYYGGMQNLLFNFMQQAMFAAMWGGEDDEEVLDGKKAKIVNSMADGLLRGMGVKAAIFVAIKNTAVKLYERSKKDVNKDYRYYAVMGLLSVSPPLSSKASKLSKAASAYQYGEDEMKYGKFGLDSPELTIGANLVSFATSLPTDRLLTKAINVSDALDASNEPWERLFMTMGWPKWTLSTKKESDLERKEDKAEIKEAKEKAEFDAMTPLEQKVKALEDLKKFQQVDSLKAYGLTDKEIRLLTREEDRINKILSLEGSEKKGISPADKAEEKLYDLKKKQQVDSLTKYGLTKKQIRDLKYEEDRVNEILRLRKKQKKIKDTLK